MANVITKTYTIKSGTIKAKEGGKDYIELVDQGDKTQRIFRSVSRLDGSWCNLDDEVEILKEYIGNNSIEGLVLSLTKEKKGQWWNVVSVDFEPIETGAIKTQFKTDADVVTDDYTPKLKPKIEYRGRDEDRTDTRTFILEVGANYRAGKWAEKHPLYSPYLNLLTLIGTGVKAEVIKQSELPKTISVGDIKEAREQYGWSLDDMVKFCRKDKGWKIDKTGELGQEQRKELIEHIKANPKKGG